MVTFEENVSEVSKVTLCLLFMIAFAIRLLIHQLGIMHTVDVRFFQNWAIALQMQGPSGFYERGITDYPPLYLYVLWIIGIIRSYFGWEILSPEFNLAVAIPAMISDLAIGYLIYFFALKKTNNAISAQLIASVWLFNPAIIVNSSMWGQIDSVLMLPLIVSFFFLKDKKLMGAYMFYGLALLTKPQALILGPIYLYSAIVYVRDSGLHPWKNKGKEVLYMTGYIASALGIMVLLSVPFTRNLNFMPIIRQFFGTMGQYNFGTLNAYNFFYLIGGNFQPLDTRFFGLPYLYWGVLFVGIILISILAALHADYPDTCELVSKTKKSAVMVRKPGMQNLYLIAAALFVLAFMFSVKMHERYLYYALPFMLLSCIEKKDKRQYLLFAALSVSVFINTFTILTGWNRDIIAMPTAIVNITLAGYLVYLLSSSIWSEKNWFTSLKKIVSHFAPPKSYKPPSRMKAKDWGLLTVLMAVMTIVTFTNLGHNFAPQTSWSPAAGETAIVDFGEVVEVSTFMFYMGHDNNRSFMLSASEDGQVWSTLYYSSRDYSVFQWRRINLDIQARYMEIVPFGLVGLRIQEAAFRGSDGELLPIYNFSPGTEALFDEQHLVPERSHFMFGTYFDEVHYVRTGYEFLHRLPPGERTHPPLGKVIQSASIAIFGMTPFAWRLPGALFGLTMIPLIYAFARQIFKSNNWAFFAAFIFSFDFMRFVQTRIATIDSYITFFVIAMYFFMYLYVSKSRHMSFARSAILLILCGASMGLAIASKWQGGFAALGLPILFFPVWLEMYKENKKKAFATAGVCVVAFVIFPFILYALSYIQFTNSLSAESFSDAIRIFWDNQQFMLSFHGTLVSDHPYGSQWWSWPLMLVPFHYYSSTAAGLRVGIVAFGNPAIWWGGIPITLFAVYRLIRPKKCGDEAANKPNYTLIFLLIGFAMQYLPWAFIFRETYIYHFFPSVPFVVLLITWFFKTQLKKPQYAIGYAVLVAGLFIMFYPVLSGMPVEWDYVRTWLGWVPGIVWR